MSLLVEIIDDDPEMREVLLGYIPHYFPDVEFVINGECSKLERCPDVLVMDYLLGFGKLASAHRCSDEHSCSERPPKRLYFTGFTKEAVDLPIDDVIQKPSLDDLVRRIAKELGLPDPLAK